MAENEPSQRQQSAKALPMPPPKYVPPNRDHLRREYAQPWKEKGKLVNKDTSYIG